MHLEIAEYLQCPARHAQGLCVVLPDEMIGRSVRRGIVACPVCHREYPVRDGVVDFGGAAAVFDPFLPAPDVVQALMDLGGPGGHVVLVGSAARLALPLHARVGGVHFMAANAPPDVEDSDAVSLVRHPSVLPLRDAIARGVVVGREHCTAAWLREGARVLLRGLRFVALVPAVDVAGVQQLASGEGMWVGAKR